jgi:hypothetical protein
MIKPEPVTLEGRGVRLEPLSLEHHDGLLAAAAAAACVRISRLQSSRMANGQFQFQVAARH